MFNKIKEKFLNKQFLTFGIIGGINTILSQVLYIVFVKFNIVVSLSSLLGDVLTMIISYFANMKYTYHEKPSWKSAITFPLSYVPGFIINMLLVVLVADVFHAPKEYAKLVSLPITIPLNYICMSLIVKKTSKKEDRGVLDE
ncbi:MAG: GtrA family protein [Anaerorhabdus sp.]|uniref:GtrA family protein n=1 Tax=Anaerorhabdus sp. TaxID=1872524 RepID=UPI002FC732E0